MRICKPKLAVVTPFHTVFYVIAFRLSLPGFPSSTTRPIGLEIDGRRHEGFGHFQSSVRSFENVKHTYANRANEFRQFLIVVIVQSNGTKNDVE